MELQIKPKNEKTAIITGITGQDGAYLSQLLLHKGYRVIGLHRHSAAADTYRLAYLGILGDVELLNVDLTNLDECKQLLIRFRPDEIYNLAAQSSVSMSFSQPRETIEFNIVSVLNLLEAIRHIRPEAKFYQASSSEMFGKVNSLPITNATQLHPLSPYGISKATGHWMVSQYREAYGLFAASGILFNHESYLRPETFFVKKVIKAAIRIKHGLQKELVVGNIDIRRDFGFAREYVKAIWLILQHHEARDYQVCSGLSISLRDIIYYIFDSFNLDRELIIQDKRLYRPTEIEDIYGDNTDIKKLTGWTYNMTFYEVLDMLMEEEKENFIND